MYVVCVCPLCALKLCTSHPHAALRPFPQYFHSHWHSFLNGLFAYSYACFALVCFCVFAAQQTRSINMHTLTHSHKHNCNYVWISIEFPKLKTHKTKHVNRLEHNNDTHLFLNGFSMLFFCSLSSLF